MIKDDLDKIKNDSKISNEGFLVAGDRWLLDNNVVTEVTHNNIIMNLYMNFPKVKSVEYYMDLENKKIEVLMYYGAFRYYLTSTEKLKEDVKTLLKQYLKDFEVNTEKRKHSSKS